jgi:hypothetical protein
MIQSKPCLILPSQKKQQRKLLIHKAKATEKIIAESKYQEAIEKLTNDVKKHVEDWLLDVPAREGESSKQQVLEQIENILLELKILL